MSETIIAVKGIGESTVEILEKHGIKTIADLAGYTVEQLVIVPGFSGIRAARVIEDARSLLSVTESVDKKPGKTRTKKSKKENNRKKPKKETKKKQKKNKNKKNDRKKKSKK